MRKLLTCWLFVCMWFVSSVPASAQNITSYEAVIQFEAGGATTLKPITFAATTVSCGVGRAPATTTSWLLPTDTVKLQWEPDATRVCLWTGPAASTLGLSTGTLYKATLAAINEAGQKGDPSTPSNPFGIAGKPATIQRVFVGPGT